MNTLIIEDEKAAARNLKVLLQEVSPEIQIVGETDSITDSIAWLKSNPAPQLVFMDIHLADGNAFEIFEHVHIDCPIIFTTAYDEYALQAFKVNSIGYLLKPINRTDLSEALRKLELFKKTSPDIESIFRKLKRTESYKTHFLIPAKGDKLLPLSANSIMYFYINDGNVKAVDEHQCEYLFPQTLDEISESLDPRLFFRVNRQFLIAKKAIRDMDLWFNGRLSINLKITVPEKILVSKAKASEFKEWFVR